MLAWPVKDTRAKRLYFRKPGVVTNRRESWPKSDNVLLLPRATMAQHDSKSQARTAVPPQRYRQYLLLLVPYGPFFLVLVNDVVKTHA